MNEREGLSEGRDRARVISSKLRNTNVISSNTNVYCCLVDRTSERRRLRARRVTAAAQEGRKLGWAPGTVCLNERSLHVPLQADANCGYWVGVGLFLYYSNNLL